MPILKITPDQIDHLSAVGGEEERRRTLASLRETAPDRIAHLDDDAVLQLLVDGETHARRRGVTLQLACSYLSMFYVLMGPDYMEDETMRAAFSLPYLSMDDMALLLMRQTMDTAAEVG